MKGNEVVQASSDSQMAGMNCNCDSQRSEGPHFFETGEERWVEKLATKIATFELGQNSLFILLPWKDEVPMKFGRTMRRKVHRATFCGKGVSTAMVF